MTNEGTSVIQQAERLLATVQHMVLTLEHTSDAQEHLQCVEAEAIADVMRAAGFPKSADQFIEQHAYGDDDGGDDHHAMYHALRDEVDGCRECAPDGYDLGIERRKDQADG